MDKKEFRLFIVFFSVFTALFFNSSSFSLVFFVVAVVCFSSYLLGVYTVFRFFRRGVNFIVKIFKELREKIFEIYKGLGNV